MYTGKEVIVKMRLAVHHFPLFARGENQYLATLQRPIPTTNCIPFSSRTPVTVHMIVVRHRRWQKKDGVNLIHEGGSQSEPMSMPSA
eukprot:SAG31_NODE_2856_length_4992_cov_2.079910_2_plen_87_part_00